MADETKPENPPAFPTLGDKFITGPDGTRGPAAAWGMGGEDGMTLRDYFAGRAPKDLADDYTREMAASVLGITPEKYTEDFFDNWCLLDSTLRFRWAGAMLKARNA